MWDRGEGMREVIDFYRKDCTRKAKNHIKGNFLLILQFVALKKLTLDHQKSHISYNLIFNS